MSLIRHSHDCPDCGTQNLKRHRVEERQPKFIQYEYRCDGCGSRFVGVETIEMRRAFGDSDVHDNSIPLGPKIKRLLEKNL